MPGHQPVISSHLSRVEGKGFFQGKHSDNVSFISGSEGKKKKADQGSNLLMIKRYIVIMKHWIFTFGGGGN